MPQFLLSIKNISTLILKMTFSSPYIFLRKILKVNYDGLQSVLFAIFVSFEKF